MFYRIAIFIAALLAATAIARAEPIEGKWRTQSGANASISKCGGSYCISLTSGKHKGKQIGRVKGSGAKYSGSVTDPDNGKQYSGSARVSGNSMKLSGCVLGVLCRTQNWTRR